MIRKLRLVGIPCLSVMHTKTFLYTLFFNFIHFMIFRPLPLLILILTAKFTLTKNATTSTITMLEPSYTMKDTGQPSNRISSSVTSSNASIETSFASRTINFALYSNTFETRNTNDTTRIIKTMSMMIIKQSRTPLIKSQLLKTSIMKTIDHPSIKTSDVRHQVLSSSAITTTSPTNSPINNDDNGGLSIGLIVLIIVLCLSLVASVGFSLFYYKKQKRLVRVMFV